MILEVAVLNIIKGKQSDFENAFNRAKVIIAHRKGYISHELQKCIENDHQYLLLVKWETATPFLRSISRCGTLLCGLRDGN